LATGMDADLVPENRDDIGIHQLPFAGGGYG
jgi:hypothetical protein